jgi:hypothetical protein
MNGTSQPSDRATSAIFGSSVERIRRSSGVSLAASML